MREPIRDRGRLEHMLAAIDRVMDYMEGKSFDDLTEGSIAYYGIVKNIEIIGEAAYKLSQQFRETHSSTPWAVIVKMRHVLVHDYYQISAREVWKVIQEDLNPLRQQIAKLITDTNWEEWANKE